MKKYECRNKLLIRRDYRRVGSVLLSNLEMCHSRCVYSTINLIMYYTYSHSQHNYIVSE